MSNLDAWKTTAKGFKKSGFIKNVVKVRLKKFDNKVYSVTAEDMIMI